MKNSCHIERDISLIKFNKRVAEEAGDKSMPMFERFKFLSIYKSNMQEFYQIRVGSLFDDLHSLESGMSESERLQNLLDAILEEVKKTDNFVQGVYLDWTQDFEKFGFVFAKLSNIDQIQEKRVKEYFKKNIMPFLSPIVVAKNDMFIHLQTGKVTLVVEFVKGNKSLYGVCEMPAEVERALIDKADDRLSIYLVEDMLLKFADKVFDGMKIKRQALVKITRNADIDIDEARASSSDYRNMLSLILKRRSSLLPVRVEYRGDFSDELRNFILKRIRIDGDHITESHVPLDFGFIKEIEDFTHFAGITTKTTVKGLDSKKHVPIEQAEYANAPSMIELAKQKDLFFSYPYTSFTPFTRFLNESATSKDVAEIKMTLYRVAPNSSIVETLCKASTSGKKVTVLIELKARFDEKNNIDISRQLQQAGCDVYFGIQGYKVHSKLVEVKFKNGECLTYIGTGNFHEITAKLYADIGVLTSDKVIGEDADRFFHDITNEEINEEYQKLLVSPRYLKSEIINLIDGEIEKALKHKQALIIFKCNALTHPEIIDKLIEASRLGVEIKLIVRGACSILPNVPNETESVEVRSIVGEFLEHARIFSFGVGVNRKIIIGSADIMKRNLDHRYEVAYMVEDKNIKRQIGEMLKMNLKDNVNARVCDSEGEYRIMPLQEGEKRISCQSFFKNQAKAKNRQ